MRLVGSVLAMSVAATLVVVAFVHFPIPYLQLKPLKPSGRLPSFWDVGPPDALEPPPLTAQQVARMQSISRGGVAGDVGSAEALEYGRRLLSGRGAARDEAAAAKWFIHAAQLGDYRAVLLLGHMHEFGRGFPRDLLRAADVYKPLAEGGRNGAAEARSRLCALRDYVPAAEKAGPRFRVCGP